MEIKIRTSHPIRRGVMPDDKHPRFRSRRAISLGWAIFSGTEAGDAATSGRAEVRHNRRRASLHFRRQDDYHDRSRALSTPAAAPFPSRIKR